MKKFLIISFAALLIISCAHGKTEHFPTVENQTDAAEVFVIRDNNFIGWGVSLKVALDDSIIARLRSGEYVTLTVPFEKGGTYHFLISAEYTKFGFDIRRIGDRQAEMWLSKTKPID
jgi:hypothetical protein